MTEIPFLRHKIDCLIVKPPQPIPHADLVMRHTGLFQLARARWDEFNSGTECVDDTLGHRAEAPASLPGEDTQAHRFGRAREAQATVLTEDYVELIDDLVTTEGEARPTDIARRLGVAHATAIKTISRLKRDGFATSRPYRGVFLTEQGRELAGRVRARHRLVVEVLMAMGVPADVAEADAEGIEHYVSPTTLAAFAAFVGRTGEAV